MSDFLTHLVQRALSPTAEVRPRFPSRFETARSHPPFANADFANEETFAPHPPEQTAPRFAETPSNPAAPARQNPRAPIASDLGVSAIDTAPPQFASRLESASRPPATPSDFPTDSASVRAQTLARGNQPAPTRAAPAGEFAAPLSTENNLPAAPAANRTRTPPNPTRAVPRDILPPSTEPLPDETSARPSAFRSPPTPASPRMPLEVHATKSSPPRPAPAAAEHAPAARIVPVASAAEETAPPPIHVTIGRIEIRATTTPAPPRPASPPSARLGLEDYLHRAPGGRR